jgi:hypothetical protein
VFQFGQKYIQQYDKHKDYSVSITVCGFSLRYFQRFSILSVILHDVHTDLLLSPPSYLGGHCLLVFL